MPKVEEDLIQRLSDSISDDVGNMHEDDIDEITSQFNQTLATALGAFNSSTLDDDGFIKKLRNLDLDNAKDRDMMKNVLNSIRTDYINVESLNHSELLLRRDISNICQQMPEMRDVIYVIRDAIVEANTATGEVSRTISFDNHEGEEGYLSQVRDLEKRFRLPMSTKNFIIPNGLRNGEMYIQTTPYAKLFAELEEIKKNKYPNGSYTANPMNTVFKESVPTEVREYFKESVSLYSEENVKALMESASSGTKLDSTNDYKIDNPNTIESQASKVNESVNKEEISSLLKNINVYNGSSTFSAEMGDDAFSEFVLREYSEFCKNNNSLNENQKPSQHFMEAMSSINKIANGGGVFSNIDQDVVDDKKYSDVKGCYVKYLDALKLAPIRLDRRVIGYYYVTTTMDLQRNAAHPNGMIDLSFQHYTRDKNLVDNLANMIIRSFDKKMLDKNIQLKNEIAEIIMAHKFSEGKLSFIYIPENEVVRIVINEDEDGRGHSVLEPTLFPARNYLMLTLYNMLFTLNNTMTRIHYVKSSGLNKDYAAQVQRTMRKFQSRRITIDDIYSFSGVLNKVGGMGEMVLPAGRGDVRALDTETIETVQNPISIEFLEQQRRQALTGTGSPNLLVINALDEVDFAKTLEMANARFVSNVASYKIDFNDGITELYRRLLKHCTDIPEDVIASFRFQFNAIKQPDLVITADMISNFNTMVEMVQSIYYSKSDMEDEKGNPTNKQKQLRKALAKKYLPQLDFDELDEIIKEVDLLSGEDDLQQIVTDITIEDEEVEDIDDEDKKK